MLRSRPSCRRPRRRRRPRRALPADVAAPPWPRLARGGRALRLRVRDRLDALVAGAGRDGCRDDDGCDLRGGPADERAPDGCSARPCGPAGGRHARRACADARAGADGCPVPAAAVVAVPAPAPAPPSPVAPTPIDGTPIEGRPTAARRRGRALEEGETDGSGQEGEALERAPLLALHLRESRAGGALVEMLLEAPSILAREAAVELLRHRELGALAGDEVLELVRERAPGAEEQRLERRRA